jgi:hypothetical protein
MQRRSFFELLRRERRSERTQEREPSQKTGSLTSLEHFLPLIRYKRTI